MTVLIVGSVEQYQQMAVAVDQADAAAGFTLRCTWRRNNDGACMRRQVRQRLVLLPSFLAALV